MKNSVESGDLIHRALEDIADLGDSFMVIAIYDGEFITDYIDCDMPTREEMDGSKISFNSFLIGEVSFSESPIPKISSGDIPRAFERETILSLPIFSIIPFSHFLTVDLPTPTISPTCSSVSFFSSRFSFNMFSIVEKSPFLNYNIKVS